MNKTCFAIALCLALVPSLFAQNASKILYLTDYDNIYHKYQEQADAVRLLLEQQLSSHVAVVGRSQGELTAFLRKPSFAEGYDLIVYNACLADSRDYLLAANLMDQSRQRGIPMMLLHCAMHNFRGSSSELGPVAAARLAWDQRRWHRQQGDRPFPTWWQFTGVDSTSHSLRQRRIRVRTVGSHPILEGLPATWTTPKDELYHIKAQTEGVIPLLSTDDGQELLAWLHPVGRSQVFATTLGHHAASFQHPQFSQLLGRAARFLLGRLDELPGPGEIFYNYAATVRCQPSQVLTARTVAEVQAGIRLALGRGQRVKVVSVPKPNSYSQVLCPEKGGMILQLAGMNHVLSVDRQRRLVRVEPGVKLDQLGRALEPLGLTLGTTADFSAISVAGALGTGAHHSSLTRPTGVHDYVEAITLVDGFGEIRTLRGVAARRAAVHLGYLGAIVAIELRLQDQFKLRYGWESGSDEGLERIFEARVRDHDYARVNWFVGVGRYVIDYYDQVSPSTPGDSYHNLWQSTAAPSRFLGALPYKALNRLPQLVQCSASQVRAGVWLPPIQGVGSPWQQPVGLAHRMLGSSCEPGQCPWDYGAKTRTQELAIPLAAVRDWMLDVRQIIAGRRACFPVLGIYMRFAQRSEAWLSAANGEESMMFEIHVPLEEDRNRYEQGTPVYDEIVQMSLVKYGAKPHWGKNSSPLFSEVLSRYQRAQEFEALKEELDPRGLFENQFWRVIAGPDGLIKPYPSCTLERDCICHQDSDCAPGFRCGAGVDFAPARVCLPAEQ